MLKGTVTYSDEDGNITATTIVDFLQEWILTAEDASIKIGGNVLELSKRCPTRSNRFINNTCDAFPMVQESQSSKSSIEYNIVGGTFFGGVIIGVLLSVLLILIWLG